MLHRNSNLYIYFTLVNRIASSIYLMNVELLQEWEAAVKTLM